MKRIFAGTCMAAIVAFGMVAFAQTTGQTPAQQPAQPTTQPPSTTPQTPPQTPPQSEAPMEQVTIVGCVQTEADYRRARDAGKGGVAGTGAGVANEFVLIHASKSTGTGAAGTTGTEPAGGVTGGTMASATGDAYELTGPNESEVGRHVGKRVEITGKLKRAETGPAGTTGGATAGTPPTGVDITSRDLRLRELEVVSVKETTGSCAPMPR